MKYLSHGQFAHRKSHTDYLGIEPWPQLLFSMNSFFYK